MSSITCPFCKEKIKEGAVKCKHCGSILSKTPFYENNHIDTIIKQGLNDHFEIITTIGKGGMATVYKAVQRNLKRPVALKVVHPNLVHDKEFLVRFHREAQISASLRHTNIVTIYDIGTINGIHFISMELLEGKDLHSIIKYEKRISVNDLILTISPIANALGYAHSKKLVHRDIKSSNIFITKDGRPVLTDFGIAHADQHTQLTQAGAILGTPDYMSPEQADGRPIDGRSDIFSLGIVMYECLTGQLPFKSENPLSTINAIINKNPIPASQFNKEIPKWLENTLNKCLEKKVQDRTQSAYDLENQLLNSEQNTDSHSASLLQTMEKNKLVILLSSIAFILSIVLFSIGFYVSHKTNKQYSQKPYHSTSPTKIQTSIESSKENNKTETFSPEATPKEKEVSVITEQPLETSINQEPSTNNESTDNSDSNSINNLEKLIEDASKAFKKHYYKTCLSKTTQILSIDAKNPTALDLKSRAISAIEESKKLSNLNFDNLVRMADRNYINSNSDSALFYYQQAHKIKPSNSDVNDYIEQLSEVLEDYKNQLQGNINEANHAINNGQLEAGYDILVAVFSTGYQTFELRDQINEIRLTLEQQWIDQAQQNMISVEGGTFEMGSNQSSADQKPKHSVNISSFQIDYCEVTVEEYRRYCKINNIKMPSAPSGGWKYEHPIVNITWNDAYKYARWVGKRLPTEAEWEFAARGGNASHNFKYSGSNIASQVAWYNTTRVQQPNRKAPNELGLYDMSGNVWEWCWDYYNSDYYNNSPSTNPKGPSSGSKKVIRGGCFNSSSNEVKIKYRNSEKPNSKSNKIGFRCVKDY